MKRLLVLLLLCAPAYSAPQATTPENGALILVDKLSSITEEDPVATHGISPVGLLDIKKSHEELALQDVGERQADSIAVAIIGAINRPGHYFIKSDTALSGLITAAGGFARLSTGNLILRRGDTLFRIYIGRTHTVSPAVKDVLPLFLLKDGDTVWISEPTPF